MQSKTFRYSVLILVAFFGGVTVASYQVTHSKNNPESSEPGTVSAASKEDFEVKMEIEEVSSIYGEKDNKKIIQLPMDFPHDIPAPSGINLTSVRMSPNKTDVSFRGITLRPVSNVMLYYREKSASFGWEEINSTSGRGNQTADYVKGDRLMSVTTSTDREGTLLIVSVAMKSPGAKVPGKTLAKAVVAGK